MTNIVRTSPISQRLLTWFSENRRPLPWRLERTAYGTWISEIMLQQTRVTTVIPYYHRFLDHFPTLKDLAQAELDQVYKCWEGLGYYSRARNLHKGAQYVMEFFDGIIPDSKRDLLKIPGVGSYTAGAISSLAFQHPEPAVDGNVIRIFCRLFALDLEATAQTTRKIIEDKVAELMPVQEATDFNEALMDLGSSICLPKVPHCESCPLATLCQGNLLGYPQRFPWRKSKAPLPILSYTLVLLRKEQAVFLCKRPAEGLLGGLYEFLSFSGTLSPLEVSNVLKAIFPALTFANEIRPLENSFHVFSHMKWEMTAYEISVQDEAKSLLTFAEDSTGQLKKEGSFFSLEAAQKLTFPSAYKAYTRYLGLS